MIGVQRAIIPNEVAQIGHLLKVGGHVGIVPPKVNIVELNEYNVFDLAAGGTQQARRIRIHRRAGHDRTDHESKQAMIDGFESPHSRPPFAFFESSQISRPNNWVPVWIGGLF
jgi:hypothetical protein